MNVYIEIPPVPDTNALLRRPAAVLARSAWLLLLSKYTGKEFLEFETSDSIDLEAHTTSTIDLSRGRPITELLRYVEQHLAGCTLHFCSTAIHVLSAHESIRTKNYTTHAISFRPQTGKKVGCNGNVVKGPHGTLELEFSLQAGGASIAITHAHGTANTIQLDRFMQQLRGVILSLATCSTTSLLGEINYMISSDLKQLESWNRSMPAPMEACVHLIASERAREHPQYTAISAPDGVLTYAELEDFANLLASQLVQLGVLRQSFVPLCFEKSKWNLVAMLATLKVGAVFVPIDPTCPDQRVRSIVRQTNAKFALSSPKMASLFKPHVEIVFEVAMQPLLSANVEDDLKALPAKGRPGDLAYAIFTSGTSGEPKGVLIEHRGICTSIRSVNDLIKINNSSRVMQLSSHAFDFSIGEMISTLMNGATLCIPTEEEMGDIGAFIVREKITTAMMTPLFTRVLDQTCLRGLESLIWGGEVVTTEDILGRVDQVKRLISGYGPSEASCFSAIVEFDGELVAATNIGRPTGCIHWVVNPNDHSLLVPIGAVGELLIEGPIVGAGYLGDPERTAKVFVQKPYWLQSMYPQRSERLYLTGDLVRNLPDGTLEYIGRKDTQVKLRGLRIELGEIESQLRQCLGGLVDVAVDIVNSSDNRKLLVAFLHLAESNDDGKGPAVLLTDGAVSRAGELAQSLQPRLAKRIPGYMIPEVFCLLSKMPYTVSRKCDRRALRAWGSDDVLSRYQGWSTIRPNDMVTTKKESILKHAWLGVVSAQNVDRDSNFFHSGADSLTAIRLVSALRSQQWTLTVQDIFLHPKLFDMASVMSATGSFPEAKVSPFSLIQNPEEVISSCALACNIAQIDIEDIFPCTPFQAAVIAVSLQFPESYLIQQCITIPPTISDETLAHAWKDISTHDYVLRSRCVDTSEGLMQVVLSAASAVSSKLAQIKGNLEIYLKEDKSITMSLGHPLARVCMVSDGMANRTLVVSMHHAVCDLWSVSQLLQRLREHISGRAYDIPTHPSLLAHYIQNRDIDEALAFWRKQLADAPTVPFLILPSERFQPLTNSTLDRTFATRQSGESNLTTASYIRAAWALTVASYSGTSDVVFGTTVNGRTIPISGIETMAGPAIATIPVRVIVPNKIQSAKAFVKEVQDGFAFAMPFEQIGLQNISRASSDAQVACKFQNLLVIDAEPGPKKELSR
jgi:amino acid adenylation domain-containing protein